MGMEGIHFLDKIVSQENKRVNERKDFGKRGRF
jgi:hypothetical protein